MVGHGAVPNTHQLGVVRFGGHRENGETAAQCTIREIREETSLDMFFYNNDITYYLSEGMDLESLQKTNLRQPLNPILVKRGDDAMLSVMYLAYGVGELKPAMETQGILLLRYQDIKALCATSITLGQYKERGGKLLLANALSDEAILSPNVQLLFFNNLFELEPELMADFIRSAPKKP